ncbi:MAG: carbohydrate ABC transporter permease [Acholeplasmatales bacterium]|jgi:multiple sugar transport system permease protein|nr:carbohydrate ABC transporter permease [Acholeplasmataceae bacterium]MDY0115040.1 carbohydrate ABC transporter permease [Acholeplasmatales bacterium]MCK9233855.1 carbohydrate ABC transporter permease [Acholeplasmataceae bacterium]MCK9289376.1 carbohydrate ABC transporter permease [Acholeplasmataceae bacterium]MCK9428075.1 carbohydrate ABC transporter permease [Acholeplasmataceae bacterium]
MEITLKKPKNIKTKNIIITIVYYFFLSVGALAMLLPFFWMLSTSFKFENEIFAVPIKWFPSKLTNFNFKRALEVQPLFLQMANTFLLALLKIVGEVFVSALIAFGFSRFEFKGKNVLFMILLATMMLPYEVTMIPSFIIWTKLGLTDSYVPLALPAYFGSATFIFFLKMYFETFPKDYEESAIIDGANYFTIFTRIFIPLAKPALITISLWSFMGTWNDLLGQLIYINSESKYTIQLGLSTFSSMTGEVLWGPLMAASAIGLVPVIFILLFAQRYFVEGVKMTGIKG